MELLAFVAANPYLSFFMALILSGVLIQLMVILRDLYVNTIWCIRGNAPVIKTPDMDELDVVAAKATCTKKETDENKLKDCR